MTPVTDPSLLAALDGPQPVSDPALLAQLDGHPSFGQVAINAGNKFIAGVPDAVLNTPSNVMNLLRMTKGVITGNPQDSDIQPTPDFVHRGFEALGFIKPQAEPQTAPQRILDTSIQGGLGALLSPASSAKQLVTNALLGIAGGGASGATKEVTGSEPLAIAASMAVPGAAGVMRPGAENKITAAQQRQSARSVEDETLARGRDLGYTVPVSETNPSWLNSRLEGLAGKSAVAQESRIRNQDVTTAAAVDELGLPKETAITEGKLNDYRDSVSQPYRDIAALSPAAGANLEKLKDARFNANSYNKFYDRSADPEALKKAKAYSAQADLIESQLEQIAARRGQPDLVDQLREARKQIAKSYDIDRALNLGNAEVSAPNIGQALDRGAPFTGNLETIGRMAQAFPRYMGEGASTPPPGQSSRQGVIAALTGTGAAGAAHFLGGGPAATAIAGTAGAALPFLDSPARALVLSKGYQKFMGQPNYSPGMIPNAIENLPGGLSGDALRSLLIARAIAERNQ